ncbi:MAG: hypothetical protein ACKO37_06255 [Vampirovibrionales bacterium]
MHSTTFSLRLNGSFNQESRESTNMTIFTFRNVFIQRLTLWGFLIMVGFISSMPQGLAATAHPLKATTPFSESSTEDTSLGLTHVQRKKSARFKKGRGKQATPSNTNTPRPTSEDANTLKIESKTVEYDETKGVYIAKGDVTVTAPSEKTSMSGDLMIYDPTKNMVYAKGHVVIRRDGQEIKGEVAKINLSKESILIKNPYTTLNAVALKAREGYSDETFVHLKRGVALIAPSPQASYKMVTEQQNVGIISAPELGAITGANNAENLAPEPFGRLNSTAHGKQLAPQSLGGVLAQGLGQSTNASPSVEVLDLHTPETPNLITQWRLQLAGEDLSSNLEEAYNPYTGVSSWTDEEASFSSLEAEQDETQPMATEAQEAMLAAFPYEPPSTGKKLTFYTPKLTAQRVNDHYLEITAKTPRARVGKFPVMALPLMKMGLNQITGQKQILFPAQGSDQNLGGIYIGPSLSATIGREGLFRLSPALSYGNSGRRYDGGRRLERVSGAGFVLEGLYRDPRTQIKAGYGTLTNQFVVNAVSRPFLKRQPNLQFRATKNEMYGVSDYISFIPERPTWSLQVQDEWQTSQLLPYLTVSSHIGAGVFKDDFFPNNRSIFFVSPSTPSPQTEGRARVAFAVQPTVPLIQIPKVLAFNVFGQVISNVYTTGDTYTLLQGGPTLSVNIKDRLFSKAIYTASYMGGSTPFVFDKYFLGGSGLTLVNAIRLSKHVTIGASQMMNLSQNNARSDLLVGNMVFLSVGPQDIKFNLQLDFIRRNVSFNINYFPGKDPLPIYFDQFQGHQ